MKWENNRQLKFESIAKPNTTHTKSILNLLIILFESIAKTNTTHTLFIRLTIMFCLRVLLKQIQHTREHKYSDFNFV